MKLTKHRSKQTSIVLCLQRSQLQFYKSDNPALQALDLSALVRDLDVLNEVEFHALLEKTFKQFGVTEKDSVVLLLDASISFVKKLETPAKKSKVKKESDSTSSDQASATADMTKEKMSDDLDSWLDEERLKFTKSVPFANTYSTVLDVGKEKMIVAVNRDLYEPIVRVLETFHCKLTHILPLVALPERFGNGVTADSITALLSVLDKYKSVNLLESSAEREPEAIVSGTIQSKEHPKRIFQLIAVFVLLLLALGGVLYYSYQRDQADIQALQEQTADLTSAEELEQQVASEEAVEDLLSQISALTVQIESSDASQAVAVARLLMDLGIPAENIATSSAQPESATSSAQLQVGLVQFDPTVAPLVQEALLDALRSSIEVSATEFVPELGVDMRIRI